MKAKPISISLCEELEQAAKVRMRQERMTRSEYFRKCLREELSRFQAAEAARAQAPQPALQAAA